MSTHQKDWNDSGKILSSVKIIRQDFIETQVFTESQSISPQRMPINYKEKN